MHVQDGNEVRKLFNTVVPCGKFQSYPLPLGRYSHVRNSPSLGETPTGRKLQELFDRYIPLVEDEHRFHRPITIVVLTDGVPSSWLSVGIPSKR